MFDELQERLGKSLRNLRGLGKIREGNIVEALEEVRESLLAADVQYRVVQSLVDAIRSRSLGTEVLDHVEPGQQFIKIVYDELARILGESSAELPRFGAEPASLLLMGLQGSGKTTTAAKLAKFIRDEWGGRPCLVSADVRRPAAREQLIKLGNDIGVPVFSSEDTDPIALCRRAQRAVDLKEIAANVLIVDSAGRLQMDDSLMTELEMLRDAIRPKVSLYVLDAMAGQDAVRTAAEFNRRVGFDGVVVTKFDGDSRGGAALSVKISTGRPIYFVGTGETTSSLERFYPDRMASRILGMGDIVSLVEKAQETVDVAQAEKLAENLRKNGLTIEDFADQLKALRKMGSFEKLMDYLPGGGQMKKAMAGGIPEAELTRSEAIISSMTPRERRNYQVIDGNRRRRIAAGSGTSVQDVNRFLKQFLQARTLLKQMSKGGFRPSGAAPFGM